MMGRKRVTEIENLGTSIDLTSWPNVITDNLSNEDKEQYYRRRKAVEMYFSNKPHSEIYEVTSIHRNYLVNFVKRCLETDSNGEIWGYRALIPRKRTSSYNRKEIPNSTSKETNPIKTGAFHKLLQTYPNIKEVVDNGYFKRSNRSLSDPVKEIKYIHKDFVDACRKENLKAPYDYPFNTKELGRRSLYNYIKDLQNQDIARAAERYGTDAAQMIRTTGAGVHNNAMVSRPFEQVQFDGHRIDVALTLILSTPEGDELPVEIERIWVLVIVDVGTKTVLGRHYSYNKEYSASDVLHCIRNSIVPYKPREFTIPGLKFSEGGGFPSAVIPEAAWALWNELLYDHGRANVANIVKDRLKQIVKCQVNAGRIKYPLRRSLIERIFGLIEQAGGHRIISTTGSNLKDPRRKDPQKKAMKFGITGDHLEEILDVIIADYNGTPNEGVNFSTPLEAMRSRLFNTNTVNHMPEEQRSEIAFFSLQTSREVQGNTKDGRRPYIQYENVRYTNEILARSPGLIGTKIDIMVNVDDLRVIRAYLPDGSELGKLKAKGKWGIVPHSLQIRKEIYRLKNDKLIHFTLTDDPIAIYNRYLMENIKIKRNANKYKENQRNHERNINTENIESTHTIPEETGKVDSEQPPVLSLPVQQQVTRRTLRKTIIY